MKRIALLGLITESNAWSPPATRADFERYFLAYDEGCLERLCNVEANQFFRRMDELEKWEPYPVLFAVAETSGPLEKKAAAGLITEIYDRLKAAPPLDGVFVCGHGAALIAGGGSLDAAYIAAIRDVLGETVPIVVELDYHAHFPAELLRTSDAFVAYRTNPHLDISARSGTCAEILHHLMIGEPLWGAGVRIPLVLPQAAQLTTSGEPMHEVIAKLEMLMEEAGVVDISIAPGCSMADVAYQGFTVLAYSSLSIAQAQRVADELARFVWDMRERFDRTYMSVDQAVKLAMTSSITRPLVFADIADNPGGGGGGNTLWMLDAFVAAGTIHSCIGILWDPVLVDNAFAVGEGAAFTADFNQFSEWAFAEPRSFPARVIALRQGPFVEKDGMLEGGLTDLGRRALLDVNGVQVAISQNRQQVLSWQYFAECGVNIDAVRCFVVKSRGHFRAGFELLVDDEDIFEVLAPGLSSSDLSSFNWKHLPRPVYPLDRDTPAKFVQLEMRDRNAATRNSAVTGAHDATGTALISTLPFDEHYPEQPV